MSINLLSDMYFEKVIDKIPFYGEKNHSYSAVCVLKYFLPFHSLHYHSVNFSFAVWNILNLL